MAVIYHIEGRKALHGRVQAQGLPGAAVAGVAVALLTSETVTLRHIPHLPALDRLLVELRDLGAAAEWTHHHEITIKASDLQTFPLLTANHLISRLPLMVAALVMRCGVCRLELHTQDQSGLMSLMDVMRRFGALIEVQDGLLKLAFPHLHATHINMAGMDVQTCMAAMLLTALAEGSSELDGLPNDPQLLALWQILTTLGIDGQWLGDHWRATGGTLRGSSVVLDADPMEAALFSLAALLTGGEIEVQGVAATTITGFLGKLRELGAGYRVAEGSIHFWPDKPWQSVEIEATHYPNIPVGWLSLLLPLLTQTNGEAVVAPLTSELRQAADLLRSWGAEFFVGDTQLRIFGPTKLTAGTVTVNNQVEGVCGLLAALAADGTSHLTGMEVVEGQFEHLADRLWQLGAKIEREEV